MEDKGIGSLIFYLILAVIALAGSFKPRKKNVPPKQTVLRRPVQKTAQPVRPAQNAVEPARPAEMPRKPQYVPVEPVDEGHYDEPMAGAFASEGTTDEIMAGAFTSEGSIADSMAAAFASEGSVTDTMAAAFASEGLSSLAESQIKANIDNTITDSEIHDAPVYDYNARNGGAIITGGFDLKKAVIYSAVLDRKEYSF